MSYERIAQLQSRLIIGTKQTLKAMRNGYVEEVFIAEDVDSDIIETVVAEAKRQQIPYEIVDSKQKLGEACNIDVGAAAVAIKRV